jgi:hypothetical protein
MGECVQAVYEYLWNSRELLEQGVLSTEEAEVLMGKVEYFSALLGEEMEGPGK